MRTTTRSRLTAALTICLAITGVSLTTACDTKTDTTTVSIGSTAPLGGPDPTSTSNKPSKDAAADEAIAAVNRYLAVYYDLDAFRASDMTRLNTVAGDPLLTGAKGDLITRRSKGVKNAGDNPVIVPGSIRIVRNDLPSNGNGQADIEVVMCMDQSKYRPLWPNGESAQLKDAHTRIKRQWWVSNAKYPDRAGWLVVGQSAKANAPCDA